MRKNVSIALCVSVLCAVGLTGCGGGGGNGGGGARGQSLSGSVTGLGPAPDGTEVVLGRIDTTGAVVERSASTTVSGGAYAFDRTALEMGSDVVVTARVESVDLRAFVVSTTVDIDPTSEAIVRSVLERATPDAAPNAFTAEELRTVRTGADLLTAVRPVTAGSVDQAVQSIHAALRDDAAIQEFLTAAAGAGRTDAGIGDVGNLSPLGEDDRWNFAGHDSFPDRDFVNAVIINGTHPVGDVTTTVVTETNLADLGRSVDAWVAKDGGGITNYGNDDPTDFLTSQIVPYRTVEFPLIIGETATTLNHSHLTWADEDGDGRTESASVESTVTAVGVEPVNVPAGSFSGALRVETETTATLRLSASKQLVRAKTVATEWLVQDLGTVQRTIASGDELIFLQTEQLIGYHVGGVAHGIQPEFTIMTETAAFPPAVGSDGTNYLVVSCRAPADGARGVYGAIVSAAGEASVPFLIARHDCDPIYFAVPAVTWNGSHYLVVFQRNEAAGGTFGVRVSADGTPLDGPEGFVIVSNAYGAVVASDGTDSLAAWVVNGEPFAIGASRITVSGEVSAPFSIFTSTDPLQNLAATFDGTNYLVGWRRQTPDSTFPVYVARVTQAGSVLDSPGIPIATGPGSATPSALSFAFDGTNSLLTWLDYVPTSDPDVFNTNIYGRRITPDGALLDGAASSTGMEINTAPGRKDGFASTFAGMNYVIAWQVIGSRSSNYLPAGIYAARVSSDGALLDGPSSSPGLVIGAPAPGALLTQPTMQASRDGALLVWTDGTDTQSLRGSLIQSF